MSCITTLKQENRSNDFISNRQVSLASCSERPLNTDVALSDVTTPGLRRGVKGICARKLISSDLYSYAAIIVRNISVRPYNTKNTTSLTTVSDNFIAIAAPTVEWHSETAGEHLRFLSLVFGTRLLKSRRHLSARFQMFLSAGFSTAHSRML